MKPESRDDERGFDRAALLKLAGLAVALGVATWLLAPLLLPVKLPADFPKPPDLATLSPDLGALLQNADHEARRKPGSAEVVGKLGMIYHANLLFEQAEAAYRIAARLAPDDYQWAYAQAVLEEEKGSGKEQLKFLRSTLRLNPGHLSALVKLADWFFKVDQLDEAARHYEQAARAPDRGASLQATFGLGARRSAQARLEQGDRDHRAPRTRVPARSAALRIASGSLRGPWAGRKSRAGPAKQ